MPGAAVRVILCLAFAAASTPPGLGQTARPDVPPSDRFPMLKPCAATAGVLCGTLEVPENRSASGGRRIRLNVAVVPALDATPAADPLFAVTGGGPGVASVPDAPNQRLGRGAGHVMREGAASGAVHASEAVIHF